MITTSRQIPLALVFNYLFQFSNAANFEDAFSTVFDENYDVAKATTLRNQWREGDFGNFPSIEVVGSEVLGTANGAYAASNNKIYLSEGFLATASEAALVWVLLEEYGHFIDAQINSTDAAGDEGAIFAALVMGESLSGAELALLQAEDDHGVISVDGQAIAVEIANLTGDGNNNNISGTNEDDVIDGLGGNDTLSGLGGNDTLIGGAGNDSLIGGAGNDTLDGGTGTNTLDGGDGDDVLTPATGTSVDDGSTVDGGTGNDLLIADFTSANFTAINESGAGVYNHSAGFNDRTWRNYRLLTVSNVELFNIVGTPYNDDFNVKEGDIFDAGAGTDILRLNLGNATTDVNFNLSQANNQLTYGSTIVKNFEDVQTLTTGSGDDVINLGNTLTVDNGGTVNTGTGTDTLIVDFSNANFSGINDGGAGAGVYSHSAGFNDRTWRNYRLLTVSNVETFNIVGTLYNDDFNVKEGDIFDAGAGTDILRLNLGNATTDVNFNLSQADNQLTYGSTIVKNFEDVNTLTTGSGNDLINLGNTNTVDNGG
ncbi:MAG: calcium-binding protein, partial [Microcystis wesenbergii Mw_QC_S_20081001_S30]